MIVKRLAFGVDWNRLYTLSPTDAEALMAIVERAQQLERDGYSGPYRQKTVSDPFVERIEIVEVELPDEPAPAAPQPSVYTAAARNLP
jgi:hypothetical protein